MDGNEDPNDHENKDGAGKTALEAEMQKVPESEVASKRTQGACMKKKCIQTDGLKVMNSSTFENYEDMSRETVRVATFKNFPHRNLVHKILESGYFHTGMDDRTICHLCHAEVFNWNEKDNPATFHEPYCKYHRSEEKMDEDQHSSLEGTSAPSLLDTPITEPSSNLPTFVLKPTVATINLPRHNSIGIIQSGMISPKHKDMPGDPGHHSLPIIGVIAPRGAKQFVVKTSNTNVSIAPIIDEEFKEMVNKLNLFSEEDRRKTFCFKDAWKENTNNVIDFRRLAANGWFYLGNLDRTQCFSCTKVLKIWQRKDNVRKVHKLSSPNCRMVLGNERRNIPIPRFQHNSNSISPAASPHASLEPAVHASFGHSGFPSGVTDPTESLLEISEASSTGSGRQTNPPFQTPVNQTIKLPQFGAEEGWNGTSQQGNNINKTNIPPTIKLGEHLSVQVSEEQQGGTDVPASPIPGEQQGHMPPYLGQTTLYGIPNAQTEPCQEGSRPPGVPTQTAVVAMPAVPVTAAVSEWAETFPCIDPDNPSMHSTVARQETFDYHWTARGISHTDEIARAGFYATGVGDNTKCWYCGQTANHWNSQDDPWEEHARLFPNCEFVLQQKGLDFVAEVSSRQRPPRLPTSHFTPRPPTPPRPAIRMYSGESPYPSSGEESPYSSMEVPGSPRVTVFGSPFMFPFGRRQQSPPKVVDPREEEAKRKRMLETALNSELVVQAMEMGFDFSVIKRTIKRKLRDTDSLFGNAESLLEALLITPDETSSGSDSENEENAPSNPPGTSAGEQQAGSSSNVTGAAQGGDKPPSSFEGAENLDPKKLDEKLREYEQEKRCKVCLDRDASVVFVPCGHLCTCAECAGVLRTCPLCRKRIQKSMKIYTS